MRFERFYIISPSGVYLGFVIGGALPAINSKSRPPQAAFSVKRNTFVVKPRSSVGIILRSSGDP